MVLGKNRRAELQAVLVLVLIGAVVFGLLEDHVVDPWGVFNPRKFGVLILILSAFEFLSYTLTKLFNQKQSALLLGFLGGFVSSTALLIAALRTSPTRETGSTFAMVAASQLSAFAELLLITYYISPPVFRALAAPVGAAMLLIALFIYRAGRGGDSGSSAAMPLGSPLDILAVFRQAVVLALILGVVAYGQREFGEYGTTGFSLIGGIFELHGVTLANSTMFANGRLALPVVSRNIMLAVSVSLCAKIVIGHTLSRSRATRELTAFFLSLIGMVWVVALVL